MPGPLTLAIDQGTHASRALVFDASGQLVAQVQRPVALLRHGADRVEQDAGEILASVNAVVAEVLASAALHGRTIANAGLATQRSSVVAWDRHSGEPLSPVLSWQDRRGADWLAHFAAHAHIIKQRTGLPLSPHYGASKLRWLLDHVPAVQKAHHQHRLALGPLASFLLFHLLQSNPLLVDHANAARTQLWNIDSRDWDPWLLGLFGVDANTLPACRSIVHCYGILAGADIPLTAVNGDQNAAVYGLGQPCAATGIVNLGTGAFVLVPTGTDRITHPALLNGLVCSGNNGFEYTLEGTVNGAGAALSWAQEHWNIADVTEHLDEWLQRPGEPPLFINTIGGLGSPWWRPGPPAALVGSGEAVGCVETWQQIVAVAESILFLVQANLDAIREAGLPLTTLRVSGGLASSNALCQTLADLSGCTVFRPAETEATARGIAWLAAGSPPGWSGSHQGDTFTARSRPDLNERYRRFCRLLT